MLRIALAAALIVPWSSAAMADGAKPPGGYTTLQPTPPRVVREYTAPQYFFIPSIITPPNICSADQRWDIPGAVIVIPGTTTTRFTWGANDWN